LRWQAIGAIFLKLFKVEIDLKIFSRSILWNKIFAKAINLIEFIHPLPL